MKRLLIIAVIQIVLSLWFVKSYAIDRTSSNYNSLIEENIEKYDRLKFKGIQDVYIVIESLTSTGHKFGLTEDQLRTDVEIKIRRAGINVKQKGSVVMFYVNVGITEGINNLYGVSVAVEVKDMVSLLREPKYIYQATIWDKNIIAISGEYRFKDMVRQSVSDMTDKFILDYLKSKQD